MVEIMRGDMSNDVSQSLPLAIDLDGTFLRTDTLYESIAYHLFRRPFKTVMALTAVSKGRAALKHAVLSLGRIDVSSLPRNNDFVDYLNAQSETGRTLHLATAASNEIAQDVLRDSGLFSTAEGSDQHLNLKSEQKLMALKNRFPEGFVYAGDSPADLAVWKGATAGVLVSTNSAVKTEFTKLGTPLEAEFPEARYDTFKLWRKALRLHQWSKNILMFVPLVLAHMYGELGAVAMTVAAFILMGTIASGTYVLNDLSDLAADRVHRTKKTRPFAAGDLPVRDGLVGAPLLIAFGLAGAFLLNVQFGLVALIYLALTLSYSFGLKRLPMVDVFILGVLYTLRILMGIVVLGVAVSPWIIAFSFFFFYSMSLAKRHVEIIGAQDLPKKKAIPGRGYRPEDAGLTLSIGAATAAASILVIVLYLTQEAFPSGVYGAPDYLWAAPALVTVWTQRIWLLANRGELDDDPVAFAIKDRFSLVLGGLLGLAFIIAVVL